MHYEMCSRTDTGRVRGNNEDAVAFDASLGLCLLADGMGGYNAGEVASGMAVGGLWQTLGPWLRQHPQASSPQLRQAIADCVQDANRAICRLASALPGYAGMGTTLVVGVFEQGRLLLGHVGDSRCYRLRGQRVEQLTKDHSMLQQQLDAGLITPAQALASPHKNLITRALGVPGAEPIELHEHRVEPGDLYLMCSDGLSDMLSSEALDATLCAPGTLARKARQLVLLANRCGGNDNISVLLVHAHANAAPVRRVAWLRA
ncbi:MAG: PP2C family protein-serine/threonine phosphatase [Polaromonas sp.]